MIRLDEIIKTVISEVVLDKASMDIPEKLYHKAPPSLRRKISTEGLKAQVGGSYSGHWEGSGRKLRPCVFLYDSNIGEYDTTYNDDIWEVDTMSLNPNKFKEDPDRYMYDTFGSVMYMDNIPPTHLTLIKRGS